MPDKSSAPPLVMDITHPRDVRPSSTSKPVIVTNRPMIAEDPMISQAAREAVDKDFDQPSGAPSAPLVPPDESTVDRRAKTIKPIAFSHDQETVAELDSPSFEPEIALETDITSEDELSKPEVAEEVPMEPTKTPDSPAAGGSLQPVPAEHAPALQVADRPVEGTIAGLTVDEPDTDEDGESRPETPEEKHSHDLEAHVTKGTYFVPINQVGKRRSRIVLTIIFCVILVLITFDLLLDMGILKLSGVPHTTFFSI